MLSSVALLSLSQAALLTESIALIEAEMSLRLVFKQARNDGKSGAENFKTRPRLSDLGFNCMLHLFAP